MVYAIKPDEATIDRDAFANTSLRTGIQCDLLLRDRERHLGEVHYGDGSLKFTTKHGDDVTMFIVRHIGGPRAGKTEVTVGCGGTSRSPVATIALGQLLEAVGILALRLTEDLEAYDAANGG